MNVKYSAGDQDLKPNPFAYNAAINALVNSGEPGVAALSQRGCNNLGPRVFD